MSPPTQTVSRPPRSANRLPPGRVRTHRCEERWSDKITLILVSEIPDVGCRGVCATLINLLMRRSRARSIVLFLDCCYGGAFERGMTARAGGNVAVRDTGLVFQAMTGEM